MTHRSTSRPPGSSASHRADQASFGARAAFGWVDIEDDGALLDDVDVQNFPTVLIARGCSVLFFGTITPQPGTLARLVQGALDGELRQLDGAASIGVLVSRLRGHSDA